MTWVGSTGETCSVSSQSRVSLHATARGYRASINNIDAMKMKIDNRKDYILLLLYSESVRKRVNEPIVGRTRLTKMLFLFKEELLEKFRHDQNGTIAFYEFFPWSFGPFSSQVYDDLKFFQLRDFICSIDDDSETSPESVAEWEFASELEDSSDSNFTEYVEQRFTLTEKGCRFAEQLYADLSANQRNLLREFKSRTSTVPLRALLKYVYSEYPDQTTKSKIKESVLGD